MAPGDQGAARAFTRGADDGIVRMSVAIGPSRWSLIVHGGAGDVAPGEIAARVAGCERAAALGASVLSGGGSALDAVQRAVEALEDDPLFNAATGACLNADGELELDASIMDGHGLRAGGVAALPPFSHPIAIARTVMEDGRHVLLAAEGAARFAVERGFTRAVAKAMITPSAVKRLREAKVERGGAGTSGGTVGAVARDAQGHVAAATSTGGMVNKLAGRVGDSPIIGAGTYADDEAGACSTTGDGEAMLRLGLSKSIVEWMRLGLAPELAARGALTHMHARTSRSAGAIVLGRDGTLGLARTTNTMTWAARTADGHCCGS